MFDLTTLPAPALFLLAKALKDECDRKEDGVKVRREELGQHAGEFEVDETLVLDLKGLVKVSESSPDAINAQKAKPWNLFCVALLRMNAYAQAIYQLNKKLEAVGQVGVDVEAMVAAAKAAGFESGLDLEALITEAEEMDEETTKAVKKHADKVTNSIKDEVRQFRYGSVRPKIEGVTIPARGDRTDTEEEAA